MLLAAWDSEGDVGKCADAPLHPVRLRDQQAPSGPETKCAVESAHRSV
jgi:hypothetical protein